MILLENVVSNPCYLVGQSFSEYTHILNSALSVTPVWQKVLGYTHNLNTFERALSTIPV